MAQPPASYGNVDDSLLCRHVRVAADSSLLAIKQAILKAYEDQYPPADITLFSRSADEEEPGRITTDRMAKQRLLSYGSHDVLRTGDSGAKDTVLLVVSAMDDSESKLLVVPAAHSPPDEKVTEAMKGITDPVPLRLAREASLFDPLPLPSHVDDWLAQYREPPQTVSDLLKGPHARVRAGRETIYLQPIQCNVRDAPAGGGTTVPVGETDEEWLFAGVCGYLTAFFEGTPVRLLPPLTVNVSKGRGSLLGKPVRWRDHCTANGEALPHGQLDAGLILEALRPKVTQGGIVAGTGAPHSFERQELARLKQFRCSLDLL